MILGNFSVIVDNCRIIMHLLSWKCENIVLIISVTKTSSGKIRKWLSYSTNTYVRGIDPVRRSVRSTTGEASVQSFPVTRFWPFICTSNHGENSFWIVPRTSGTRMCHRPSCTFLIFRLAVLRQRNGNFWDTAARQPRALHKLRDIISVTRWLLSLYFATLSRVIKPSNNMKILQLLPRRFWNFSGERISLGNLEERA